MREFLAREKVLHYRLDNGTDGNEVVTFRAQSSDQEATGHRAL